MKKFLAFLFFLFFVNLILADEKEVINQINSANIGIKSIVGSSQLVITKRPVTITLLGNFYYEKNTKFHLINKSAVDNEFASDIGSNEKEFWFYGKRINRNAMYYSSYKNLDKTRLKDSLNPQWMIEALGIGAIKMGTIQKQKDGKFFVLEERISTRRQNVIIGTLIDSFKPAIVGYYIFDKNKRCLGSIRIIESYKTTTNAYLPKKMEIKWPQENITIVWDLFDIKLNKKISEKTWTMPNLGLQTIDLSSGIIAAGVND